MKSNHPPHPLSPLGHELGAEWLTLSHRERECEYPTLHLLRDRSLPTAAFRTAARPIIRQLITDLHQHLSERGTEQNIAFVIILRAGLAFLDAAIERFPSALIASAGLRRDEETAKAHWYYRNFPPLSKDHTAVILDPMLATGGSAIAVVQELCCCGVVPKNIHFTGLLGAPEGIAALSTMLPRENILLATIDEGLDAKKFIVPGLGDFGDRYFGYTLTHDSSIQVHAQAPVRGICVGHASLL